MRRFALMGACLLAAAMAPIPAPAQMLQNPPMLTFTQPVTPQAVQLVQYTFLVKNLAAAGGLILLFVTGAGRFSVDSKLSA